MATRKEIFDIVNKVKYLPNSPVTEKNVGEIAEMFFVILKDIPYAALESAVLQYMSEAKPYFPMPGALRSKALDLQLLAMKIPTAAEAWGMVVNSRSYDEHLDCVIANEIRERAQKFIGVEYIGITRELRDHQEACRVCHKGGFINDFGHPAVASTVRLLGGLDVVLTDNRVSDRARFIEAFDEVVARERMKIGMLPEVKQYVHEQAALEEDRRAALDTGERADIDAQYRKLAKSMSR